MKTLNENYVSAGKACLMVDITIDTLYRWYRWWENENFPKPEGLYLPPYYHKDRRKTKFFKTEDIPALMKFAEDVRGPYKGCMAEFNAALMWGKRGSKILENKGTSKKEVRTKL